MRPGTKRLRKKLRRKTKRALKGGNQKYVICMPIGGMMDILCKITTFSEYCKKHNRILVIDTRHHKSIAKDSIFNYIIFNDPVIYTGNIDELYASLKGRSFYPAECGINLGSEPTPPCSKDAIHLDRVYDEDVILGNPSGGCAQPTFELLSKCKLTPLVKDIYFKRRAQLPESYISVHIRNTDYKSNVNGFITQYSKLLEDNPVFLASNSKETINSMKSKFGKIQSFSNIKNTSTAGSQHEIARTVEESREMTIDLLVDLLLLASGKEIYIGTSNSNYSQVAQKLQQAPHVLHSLLN